MIGQRSRPLDWRAITGGAQLYTADLARPGALHGAILRSPHAHARVLAIDTAAARAMPGVRAVITAADFPPGARYRHEGAADRPPMADGVVRFAGQEVAAVAADTAEQAQAALRAIAVRYRRLPAPLTIRAALAPGAAQLHERPTGLRNVAIRFRRRWGDPEAGVAAARHRASGAFWFPPQCHACMEPGVTLADWSGPDGRIHLWTSTNAPFYVVREVAHVLGLPADQVACHEVAVGGSFGARSKVCDYEVIAAALSRQAGRPVRLQLTREEDFAATKTRHGFLTDLTLHGDDAGRIRALAGRVLVDNGAYSHSGGSVMGAGVKGLGMMYEPDGLDIEAMLVDTCKQPGGQFRGYGTTQTAFALECLVDELAEASGFDPVEYRIRNANRDGGHTLVGARLGTSRLVECLEAARQAIGWDERRACPDPELGVGIAAGVHVSGSHVEPGSNRSDCVLNLDRHGMALLRFGGGDAGTGQKTILAQIAAHELALPLDQVRVLSMDSDATPFDMGAWSSRGTHYTGHAARAAAQALAGRLRALAAEALGHDAEAIKLKDGQAASPAGAIGLGALAAMAPEATDGVLTVEASYVEPAVQMGDKVTGQGNVSATYNFAAHTAAVRVDRRTGKVTVLDYVAAHDVGVALNPALVEGQIVGGAAMGLGVALGEEAIHEQGRMVNAAHLHYAMPRAGDLPAIRPIIVGGSDPNGPYGAKAVGEMGVNPPAAAIANAIHDAVGVRLRHLPLTPDKVLGALAAKAGRRRRFHLWRRPDRWWIALVRWAYGRGLFQALHRRALDRRGPAPLQPLEAVERPRDLEGLAAAVAGGAAAMGGGTDLNLRRRIGLPVASRVAAVKDVEALKGVSRAQDGGWRIGAGTTLSELAAALAGDLPAIREAVDEIASPQIRNAATVGGSLLQANRCWFLRNGFDCFKRRGGLAPCYAILGDHRFYHAAIGGHRCQSVTPSDLATVFLGLDAEALVVGPDGGRRLDFARLYIGPGESALKPGEVLAAVMVPPLAASRRMAFRKLNLWTGDFAIASVMASADVDEAGRWRRIRLALGGLASTPLRARRTEAALDGQVVDAARLRRVLDRELDALGHPLARNGWKLDAAAGLAEHAVEAINQPAQPR